MLQVHFGPMILYHSLPPPLTYFELVDLPALHSLVFVSSTPKVPRTN